MLQPMLKQIYQLQIIKKEFQKTIQILLEIIVKINVMSAKDGKTDNDNSKNLILLIEQLIPIIYLIK